MKTTKKKLFNDLFLFTRRIDIDSLETIGKKDIKQYVGVVNHTSHPHIMSDGTVCAYTYSYQIICQYEFIS